MPALQADATTPVPLSQLLGGGHGVWEDGGLEVSAVGTGELVRSRTPALTGAAFHEVGDEPLGPVDLVIGLGEQLEQGGLFLASVHRVVSRARSAVLSLFIVTIPFGVNVKFPIGELVY